MSDNLDKRFWTANSIAKQWINENCVKEIWPNADINNLTEKKLAVKITKTFGKICEKYFGKDKGYLKWYKSRSAERIEGKYLFGDEAPKFMKELFRLSQTTIKGLLEEEKEELYKCLAGLLPLFRNMDDVKSAEKLIAEEEKEEPYECLKSPNERERKSHSLLYKKPESIEPGFMGQIMNANNVKEELTKRSDIEYNKQRIRELLDSYYAGQKIGGIFPRIFMEADTRRGNLNKKFYQYQYNLVKKWENKWNYIMEKAGAVRIAERFEDTYEVFIENKIEESERKIFYREGKTSANIEQKCCPEMDDCLYEKELCECLLKIYKEDHQQPCRKESMTNATKDVCTMETCKKACEDLVSKILHHELQEISMEDFMYMKILAVRELEEIHKKTRHRKHELYYRLETGRKAEDIEILYRVRLKSEEIEEGKTILELAGQA